MFSSFKPYAILVMLVLFMVPFASASEKPCVKLDPVGLHAAPEYTYLKEGVFQVISSRLAEGGVAVLPACMAGNLSFTLTLFGGSATVTADLTGFGEGFHGSRTGKEGDLLKTVEALTSEVVAVIKGSQKRPATTSEVFHEKKRVPAKEGPSVEFRTRPFDGIVTTLAVGDVDGDGSAEGIAVASTRLLVLTFKEGRISIEKEYEIDNYLRSVRANLLDLNRDGRDELILAGIHRATEKPLSRILSFDGKSWHSAVRDEGLLLDVVTLPGQKERICIGQGLSGLEFSFPVYQVSMRNGELVRTPLEEMPEGFGVLGWDSLVVQNGQEHIFRLNPQGGLEFWEKGAKRVWRGNAGYGASLNYVTNLKGQKKIEERRYLPARVMRVESATMKGVALTQNKARMGGLFEGMKGYKKGRVAVISWNGYEVKGLSATKGYEGFVPDFSVGDFDGDSKLEALFPVVQSSGLTSGRTYFVFSELE